MDTARFVSAVSGAQDALVRVRDAGGKLTAADEGALKLLASESRKVLAELAPGVSGNVPGEAYLRDTPIVDPANPGLALTGRAWNIADGWARSISKSLALEPATVKAAAPKDDGLEWLASLCEEIVARPTRKTAGQTPGLDPINLARLKAPTIENVNAKLDLVIDAIQKIAKAGNIPL